MRRVWSFVIFSLALMPLACGSQGGDGQCSPPCKGEQTCQEGVCNNNGSIGSGGNAAGGGAGDNPAGGGTTTNGGSPASGGSADSGGSPASGGSPSTATGGDAAAGGAATGGDGSGASSGGHASGGSQNFEAPFLLGADISMTQGQTNFIDTDGMSKSIFDLLKHHGFNYIRLKTFVDPTAVDWNGCTGSTAGSKENVIEYGALAKAAGMGFLLDFHYSDTWADPGKQIIPKAWRGATTEQQLADFVEAYTYDVISSAISAGARPDMVQIGNEITPGLLTSVPGANTDCWGNDPADAPSAIAGWANQQHFIAYLKAGIAGVRRADPAIEIVLHMEHPTSAVSWLATAVAGGVDVDVFGLSCYEKYQGGYAACQSAFEALIGDQRFDGIDFIVAEYNPQRTEMNLMMHDLVGNRGRGTFFWEPTSSGDWGPSMFDGSTAIASAFQEYDDLLPELGLSAQ